MLFLWTYILNISSFHTLVLLPLLFLLFFVERLYSKLAHTLFTAIGLPVIAIGRLSTAPLCAFFTSNILSHTNQLKFFRRKHTNHSQNGHTQYTDNTHSHSHTMCLASESSHRHTWRILNSYFSPNRPPPHSQRLHNPHTARSLF